MILSICDNANVLQIMRIVKILIRIICIVAPIIMIVSSMISILGEMKDGKDEMMSNISKKIVSKTIAVILIFMIPTFVHIIANLFGDDSYIGCLNIATKEGIREAKHKTVNNLIGVASKTLTLSDYNAALNEVYKLKPDERESYLLTLKDIKAKIDVKSLVSEAERLLSIESYQKALDAVSKLSDDKLKEELNERLKKVKEKIEENKNANSTNPSVQNGEVSIPSSGDTSKLEMFFIGNSYYDDAILIRNGNNIIFIDGGRWGCVKSVTPYLQNLGVSNIDLLVGSHLHFNHIQSQGDIINNFNVKAITYPDDIYTCANRGSCDTKDQQYVLDAIKNHGLTPKITKPGDTITVGEMKLYFMEPTSIKTSGSYPQNANSSIFILTFKNNSFMFTGDISIHSSQLNSIRNYSKSFGISPDVDVLKYPHHGNSTLSDDVLSTVKPEYIIVPNNHSPKYPSSDNINRINNRGIKMYRQSDSSTGNIYVVSDGNNISVKTNF